MRLSLFSSSVQGPFLLSHLAKWYKEGHLHSTDLLFHSDPDKTILVGELLRTELPRPSHVSTSLNEHDEKLVLRPNASLLLTNQHSQSAGYSLAQAGIFAIACQTLGFQLFAVLFCQFL